MTQEQKNKEFKAITNKMLDMYSKKNELYGDSFNQLMYEWGLVAGVVPIDNKLRRIKSIIKGTEVKYESLEDSLYDLANYSILMLIHLKELKQNTSDLNVIHSNKDGSTMPSVEPKGIDGIIDPGILLLSKETPDMFSTRPTCENCLYFQQRKNLKNVEVGDTPCTWCPNNIAICHVSSETK